MTLLQLEHIYKTYSQGMMDVPALTDINLSIEQGEYVAIMGPSGSGKSTLMNIIGCLDKPTEGKLYLNGNDIGAMNDRKLSDIRNKEIGFVFQNFNLMPRQSALQNVELPLQYAHVPRKERRSLCEEALIKVGLEDRMSFKATQLSGGQKQRVAIARAMVNKPSILLADEPTGALDSKSGIQVMGIFKQLHSEGSTIIMITHAEEIARHANRIIKIFDGEIKSDEINTNKIDVDVPTAQTFAVNMPQQEAEQPKPQSVSTVEQPESVYAVEQPQSVPVVEQPKPQTVPVEAQPKTEPVVNGPQPMPQSVTVEEQPKAKSVVNGPQPAPVQEQPKPRPVVYGPQPAPVQEQPKPKPVVNGPQPVQIQEQPKPRPVVDGPQPVPVQEQPKSKPVVNGPQPVAAEEQLQPKPVVNGPQPMPQPQTVVIEDDDFEIEIEFPNNDGGDQL